MYGTIQPEAEDCAVSIGAPSPPITTSVYVIPVLQARSAVPASIIASATHSAARMPSTPAERMPPA
jgi:hypothetical protein